jgi:phenylalanyl-tRNA synthetase beta chain
MNEILSSLAFRAGIIAYCQYFFPTDIILPMRVPYTWLKEFVEFTASPEEIANRLTMAGLEVEGADVDGSDTIFEVNITPNRPDCLSIIGIARELAAILEIPLTVPPHKILGTQPESEYSVEIVNPNLSNRYAGRVITNVTITDSPEWIRRRLEKCGIRSINNIVDITNYVLLEFGHPLHAFDADLLAGKQVRVGTPSAIKGQVQQTRMQTLDGTERDIPGDSLLIWDAERPVAVAGVMGGLNTEVTNRTKNIFLESAYFDPVSVRRTSKKLGLISESSYRFERGTDIEFLEKALDRAAFLMEEVAGGTVHAIIDQYPVPYMPEPVTVRKDRINRILGTGLTTGDMVKILQRLGMSSEEKGDEIVITPPAYRRDMKRESDVSEEIARIYGYERILTTVPRSPLSSGRLNKRSLHIQRIRESMRKSGFSAVINFSFMNMSSLDSLGISSSDEREKTVAISNPLSQDECLLRTTLAPALIANLQYNLDRGIKEIYLFEISKVFESTGQPLPSERSRLGGIWYKEKSPSLWKEDAPGFYTSKGALEALFEELKVTTYSFVPSSEPFLHLGRSSDIIAGGSRIGYIGVLNPGIIAGLDLKKLKTEIVLFEVDLDLLMTCIPDSVQFSPLAKYPSVERDIAVVLDEAIPSSRIREIIASFPTSLIEDVSVFDSFKGGTIPEGKRSLAFNIIYRSRDKTLTDEEIEALHTELVRNILRETGGELRK